MVQPLTILFLATECKGEALVRQARELGCRVFLITEEKRKDDAWPRESIDQFFMMPDLSRRQDVINAVSYLAREHRIDRIVPLDDYDVEMAAALREHLRLPGMGASRARYFRDKLAMRGRAEAAGIRVPAYSGTFNDEQLRNFTETVPPPWVLKPRAEAGAVGIRKLSTAAELWPALDELGDMRSFHLLESFVPGEIYHVDSITFDGEVRFAIVHKYGRPPLSVSHEGGVFTTRTLSRDSDEAHTLRHLNEQLMVALGMEWGVAHAEFIGGEADGEFYFLEVGARVGGANIAETVEAATGINLWREWARVEAAHARGEAYQPPADENRYAGVIICLARQQHPDLSGYDEPEIVWRLEKEYHAGLIVASPDAGRTERLIGRYTERFADDFLTVGPQKKTTRTYSS